MHNTTTYHSPRNVPAEQLQRLDMTFTEHSLRALKAFRQKIHIETGRRVTLGQALDTLIKSHPFVGRAA
jgi:hypothetical protein